MDLNDRCLMIDGIVSPTSLALVRAGLPDSWPATSLCLFVSYAYADLPVGSRFDFAFPSGHPGKAEPTLAVITAVTQQFAKPLDCIPRGWKTVCLMDFPQGIPQLIAQLETIDGWHESDRRVALCTRQTMDALAKKQG